MRSPNRRRNAVSWMQQPLDAAQSFRIRKYQFLSSAIAVQSSNAMRINTIGNDARKKNTNKYTVSSRPCDRFFSEIGKGATIDASAFSIWIIWRGNIRRVFQFIFEWICLGDDRPALAAAPVLFVHGLTYTYTHSAITGHDFSYASLNSYPNAKLNRERERKREREKEYV